jgi:hypothetical protein
MALHCRGGDSTSSLLEIAVASWMEMGENMHLCAWGLKWRKGSSYREHSLAEIEGGEGMSRVAVSCEKLVEIEG